MCLEKTDFHANKRNEKVTFFLVESTFTQPAKLRKKQCDGVYFCVYGIAFRMPIQQKLTPPVLLFSDFAGWDCSILFN